MLDVAVDVELDVHSQSIWHPKVLLGRHGYFFCPSLGQYMVTATIRQEVVVIPQTNVKAIRNTNGKLILKFL